MNDYTMSNAGDLISALPSIMGYVPQARAVAITMRRNDSGGLQLRNVISIPVTTAHEHAATLPDICGVTITNTAAVILIAVCGPEHLAQAGVVLDAMRNAFLDADIPVRQRLLTASVTEAGHWMDIDTGQTGPQAAYTDSIFTAMSIVGGRPVVTSRDDLIEEFRETDPAPLLAASTAAQSPVDTAEELATVIAGAPMSPTLPTRAGLAILASARMRDVMILLGMEQPYAAAALWTTIAGRLRRAARVEALTVAAALYYVANDTTRADIALETASDLAADHDIAYPRLAALLSTALRGGMDPQTVTAVLLKASEEMDSPN
ncbi:DUF4192 domain-containing protein [Mycobacterium sp. 155]|uniref:DUF4192 domain-containing protein n=1 Tax=Mycobacterium sp. 155 TaxID=1157943 RepID=UPI00036636D8|nr:DUF4192 domain-containing protein [Mycobacterium sp. 155]